MLKIYTIFKWPKSLQFARDANAVNVPFDRDFNKEVKNSGSEMEGEGAGGTLSIMLHCYSATIISYLSLST